MRILGILFVFLTVVGLMNVVSGNMPDPLDSSNPSPIEIPHSDLSIQQSSVLELGDALTTSVFIGQPVVRVVHYFFGIQSKLSSIACKSAIDHSIERNYQKAAFSIDANFPAFCIIFPHHYFT